MKRIFSVILSLVMAFSLCSAAGICAMADEGSDEVTVLFTGGVGTAVGGEGLSYASAAALKESYDEDNVLLVDAGGFDADAAEIMTAAGYDLAVPEQELEGWSDRSISMGVEGLEPGVIFTKNSVKIAFIGIVAMGEQTQEDYYDAIQKNVDEAYNKGADYVIALGYVEDPDALAEKVSGLAAVLTYGEETAELAGEDTADVETEAEIVSEDDQTAETEAIEETEETDGAETPEQTEDASSEKPVVVCIGKEFAAIGALTIASDGSITAKTIDADEYAAMGLSENEDEAICALEEELAEKIGEANSPSVASLDEDDPKETEEPEETTEPEETEEPEETKEPEETTEPEETENPEGTTESEGDTDTADDADLPSAASLNEDELEKTEESEEDEDSLLDAVEESATVSPSDAQTTATDTPSPETASPTEPETNIITWEKDGDDLVIELDHPVASIVVKNNGNTLSTEYYELSSDSKTVTIYASVLNKWGNGYFNFEFSFSDGAASEIKTVKIYGTSTAENTTGSAAAYSARYDETYTKGTTDLVFSFTKAVSSITINGDTYTLEDKYYELSSDGMTVTVYADVLNGWDNGQYSFIFTLADGTKETKTVLITGEYTEEKQEQKEEENTDDTKSDGSNPATGDETPIAMWVIIFAVLVVVIVVVIILLVRRNKKR